MSHTATPRVISLPTKYVCRPDGCQPIEYVHKVPEVAPKVGGDERYQGGHDKGACGKHQDVLALLCTCNRAAGARITPQNQKSIIKRVSHTHAHCWHVPGDNVG